VVSALAMSDFELRGFADRALERTRDEHTVDRRARQMIEFLEGTA
jgi:hypothetical protein